MTAPGQYAAQDGSFGRSAGGAAGRGLVLIAIAVVVGLVLLAKGFDGADTTSAGSPAAEEPSAEEPAAEEPAAGDGTDVDSETPADDGTGDAPTDTTADPAQTDTARPPAEVKVAAVNATGAPGVAGRATDILDTQSYVTAAKNAATNSEVSAVYYVTGYAEEAKVVAGALGIPADLIAAAPPDVLQQIKTSENVADFHIFVFQGADGLAGK